MMLEDDRRPVVVCVDDEASVLASLRRTLRKEPYEIITTQDPREALQWIDRKPVDVVITDQRMPGMTGLQLLTAVEASRPGLACLMLTAFPDTPAVLERSRNGEMRLMTKPWAEGDLRETVRQLVKSGTRAVKPARPWIWSCPDVRELLVRLDGRDGDVSELLDRLEIARERPECDWAGWVVVLENLRALEGSTLEFVRRLTELVRLWDLPTALVDRSGTVADLFELIGATGPIALYGPEVSREQRREVLWVDRDSKTREYGQALISALGHSCTAVPSIEAAIFSKAGSRADLAFLDLGTPESNLISLFHRLEEKIPKMRLVATSTFRDLWDEDTCGLLGFNRHLQKPLRAADILGIVGVVKGAPDGGA